MSFLDGLGDILTGGLGGKIVDAISAHFPPDITPEQKANFALVAQNIELQTKIETNKAIAAAETSINERVAQYEGTASELKTIPFLGPLMLFLRGSQRIAWGFGVLYFDWQVFSGQFKLTDPQITNAFWVINLLVLGFLFGERAIQNVMPLFIEMVKAKTGASK